MWPNYINISSEWYLFGWIYLPASWPSPRSDVPAMMWCGSVLLPAYPRKMIPWADLMWYEIGCDTMKLRCDKWADEWEIVRRRWTRTAARRRNGRQPQQIRWNWHGWGWQDEQMLIVVMPHWTRLEYVIQSHFLHKFNLNGGIKGVSYGNCLTACVLCRFGKICSSSTDVQHHTTQRTISLSLNPITCCFV